MASADTSAAGLRGRTPGGHDAVREIELPPAIRRLSTLARLDYTDAFLVDIEDGADRTPEQWARLIFDDAPLWLRSALRSAWSSLGFQRPLFRAERSVLGWEVRRSTTEVVLLGGRSPLGLQAELVLKRRDVGLLFSTLVHWASPLGRAIWAVTEPGHRPVVRYVLEQGRRRGPASRVPAPEAVP